MATSTTISLCFLRTTLLVAALASSAALAAPVAAGKQVEIKSQCYRIHLMLPQKLNQSNLSRGVGLVQKHLFQAAELISEYRDSLRFHQLHNKTMPEAADAFQLPEPTHPSVVAAHGRSGEVVGMFHRLALSCLLFEDLARQAAEIEWSRPLHSIKDELVQSLCYLHVLLHVTGSHLSQSNLQDIRQLFNQSLSWVSREHREWGYLRDFRITGAVHRIAQRSIRELDEVKKWLTPPASNI